MAEPAQGADPRQSLAEAVGRVRVFAAECGREDLAGRLQAATVRMTRPSTIVTVVGEFKAGKSSLVNALLGTTVCPVDDDMATSALTLVHHGDELRVDVRRRDGDRLVVERIDPGDMPTWVSEAGNPDNTRRVERVDIALPHPMLAGGLVLVDTPGAGGIGAGHGAATLAFLPFADGVVFVTDASAELSRPEADFLVGARGRCPTVVVALSKTDLYPAWRKVAEIDTAHLRALAVDAPLVPVSSALRNAAVARHDTDLNAASGFRELAAVLEQRIVAPAKETAALRARAEGGAVLDQIESGARAALTVLADPERSGDHLHRLRDAQSRLEHLRGPGARWSVLVGDRVADLGNDANFRFRGALRTLTRSFEERIETMKSGKDWDDLARDLQTGVAEAVADTFAGIEGEAGNIRTAVAELLAEESLDLPALPAGGRRVDTAALWLGRGIDPRGAEGTKKIGTALTGLRGAQSGIIMFGMMARFLPGGVAALLMSNPVTVGIGVAFAGMQVSDAQKRTIAARRQQARVNVRQFLDDVGFEVGNEITGALREVQRSIRDEFTELIASLGRTYGDAARTAQEAVQRDASEVAARTEHLEALVRTATGLRAGLGQGQP